MIPFELLDDWILPHHKIPIFLCFTFPNPISYFKGYTFMEGSDRVAKWKYKKDIIIGLRSSMPDSTDFALDNHDDKVAAGMSHDHMYLVEEAKRYIKPNEQITFVGHSLGGRAAIELGKCFPTSKVISVFGGATPYNPVYKGDPKRMTHYHILGDLLSSHVSSYACTIIRKEKYGFHKWGMIYPHEPERLLKHDNRFAVACSWFTEQDSFQHFCNRYSMSPPPIPR